MLKVIRPQGYDGNILYPLVPLVERDMHRLKYFESFWEKKLLLPSKECRMGENWNRCIPDASTQVILFSQEDKVCESVILSACVMITLGKLGFAALTIYWYFYSAIPRSLVV